MKFGKKFFKKSSSSTSSRNMVATKMVEPSPATIKSPQSISLGGGTIDEDGLVQLLQGLQRTSQPEIGKGLRFMKRLETAGSAHTNETDTDSSISDSGSVRDENLDTFSVGGDCVDFSAWPDNQLLQGLEEAVNVEKHIRVARILDEMDSRGLKLENPVRQEQMRLNCRMMQEVLQSHGADAVTSGWTKRGVMHGRHRDTMVYHRTNERGEIAVRCETPIQGSLVAPLLSILNETDLYTTWVPSFHRPFKLGVTDTGKLMQCSLGSQVAYAKVDMPWPMANREVIAKNIMSDAVDEFGALIIRALTMEAGTEIDGLTIPECLPGWERIKMDAGLLIRKCPEDHPCMKRHNARLEKKRHNHTATAEDEEPMLLATFTLTVSPSVNTILKFIAGPMWSALVSFAEDVQRGTKGEAHRQRIQEKDELYGYVDEVVERLMLKCS